MSRIIPLDNIPGRMPRIGKISAGYMDVKTIQGRTVSFPVKSRTLVFRCGTRPCCMMPRKSPAARSADRPTRGPRECGA